MKTTKIVKFGDKDASKHELTGGKGANLGLLTQAGFKVPPGFTVMTNAYAEFILSSGLDTIIEKILGEVKYDNPVQLEACTARIRAAIVETRMPKENAVCCGCWPEPAGIRKKCSAMCRRT